MTCDVRRLKHYAIAHRIFLFDLRCRLWASIHKLNTTHQQNLKSHGDIMHQLESSKQFIKEQELQIQNDKKMWQASLDASTAAAAAAAADLAQYEVKLDAEHALVSRGSSSRRPFICEIRRRFALCR